MKVGGEELQHTGDKEVTHVFQLQDGSNMTLVWSLYKPLLGTSVSISTDNVAITVSGVRLSHMTCVSWVGYGPELLACTSIKCGKSVGATLEDVEVYGKPLSERPLILRNLLRSMWMGVYVASGQPVWGRCFCWLLGYG